MRASEENWFKKHDLKIGSHRLRSDWVDKRFSNLDEDGMPQVVASLTEKDVLQQGEPNYDVHPQDTSTLATWQDMARTGVLTSEALQELQQEPWLDMVIASSEGLEGLSDAKELLKTPAQRRAELGLDKYLTSQKPSKARVQRRTDRRKLRAQAKVQGKQAALENIRKLTGDGYSIGQAYKQTVIPSVGNKKVKKAKLLKSEAKRLKMLGALRKKRERSTKQAEAKAEAEGDAAAQAKAAQVRAFEDSRRSVKLHIAS